MFVHHGILFSALVAASTLYICAACPKINGYGARKPTSTTAHKVPTDTVIIRGGNGFYCSSMFNCPTTIYEMQKNHIKVKNLDDIDCNMVVGGDGFVYRGRGWDVATNSFPASQVICVLENRNVATIPDSFQQQAITEILRCGVTKSKLAASYTVQTPRDLNSTSEDPIQSLYEWVKKMDRYAEP
ncbi:peptidoglycan-recognition protein [Plakobranchus ocellatus]|uniref:Peptidoglycan-recognition protein n=1 Tax=Plakobranchus ocellatus TaxID=259542 RepID=A0AAV3YUZ2_9GAST|nr:peptidoglycan-recognition protein [Plakobranchus ocellatus]